MQAIDSKGTASVITALLPVIHDTRAPISQAPNLWERIAIECRARHYSLSTERTYVHWARAYCAWHGRRHPAKMGHAEVTAYLDHLAVGREVAPSTHKQAMSALIFLYRQVLHVDMPWLDALKRPQGKPRLPVVLSQAEVTRMLAATHGTPGLILRLLYGTGMRMMEALRLRVKDIDFGAGSITVRAGKGDKDRTVMLPRSLAGQLREVIERVEVEHKEKSPVLTLHFAINTGDMVASPRPGMQSPVLIHRSAPATVASKRRAV